MPRRNRAAPTPAPRAGGGRTTRREEFGGEEYDVRAVVGGTGGYRCPGCDQLIAAGVGHVVAWRAGGDGEDRRHWHTACWAGRERRTVTRRWS